METGPCSTSSYSKVPQSTAYRNICPIHANLQMTKLIITQPAYFDILGFDFERSKGRGSHKPLLTGWPELIIKLCGRMSPAKMSWVGINTLPENSGGYLQHGGTRATWSVTFLRILRNKPETTEATAGVGYWRPGYHPGK